MDQGQQLRASFIVVGDDHTWWFICCVQVEKGIYSFPVCCFGVEKCILAETTNDDAGANVS